MTQALNTQRFYGTNHGHKTGETGILSESALKPLVWKRYIDGIISLWNTNKEGVTTFTEQANNHHPTIKFTAEISETETNFLDTTVYKGERFLAESVLDIHTHFKPTDTFQYTHFFTCHPFGVKRVFTVKGELQSNTTELNRIQSFDEFDCVRQSNEIEQGTFLSSILFGNQTKILGSITFEKDV